MALIDLICTNPDCETVVENHYRRAVDWQITPACEACGSSTERFFQPPRVQWRADAVVVYRAPDGSIRYPGAGESTSTAHYDKLGYTRVELRNFADVRRFEAEVNKQSRADNQQRVESQHQQREARESVNRSELFHRMKTFSNAGRAIAREAIARGNQRPQEQTSDVGFRVEAYSENRSNRDESRSSDGRRRRD